MVYEPKLFPQQMVNIGGLPVSLEVVWCFVLSVFLLAVFSLFFKYSKAGQALSKAHQMMAERDILDQPMMVDGQLVPRRSGMTYMGKQAGIEAQGERQKLALQWARESLGARLAMAQGKYDASVYNSIMDVVPDFVSIYTTQNGEPPSRVLLDKFIEIQLEAAAQNPKRGIGGPIPGPGAPEKMTPPPIPKGSVGQGDPDQIAATFFRSNPSAQSYEVTVGNQAFKYVKKPNGKFAKTQTK